MADEITPGTAGQGADEAPGDGQGLDYERSYNELRPQFTRTTQELAEARSGLSEYEQLFAALHDPDPEVQQAAFEALGLELDTGPQGNPADDDFVDPLEQELAALRGEVTELRSARELEAEQREQAEIERLRDDFIGEAIGVIEKEVLKDREFTEREEEALGNLAIAMENEDGIPDVQGAFDLLYGDDGVLEINRQHWIETKTGAPQAPGGRSVPVDKKPTNAAERVAYIDERIRAQEQQ